MKKLTKFACITFSVLMLAGAAHAVPITGDIGIVGWGLSVIDTLTATEIPGPLKAVVSYPTGDFDTFLNSGDEIIYNGFTFDPAETPVADPLWVAGDFAFVLNSINVAFRDANQIVFDGVGILSWIGDGDYFDDTIGKWSMSIDAHSTHFAFSNGTNANPVPEPATMLLLGTGLIGLAGLGRKKLIK